MDHEAGGGLTIHLEHVLTGVVIGVLLLVPVLFYYLRKYKKFNAAVTATGKKVIHTEMVKSDIILASIVDGVIVIDNNGVISVFNQGATILTGWPNEEAIGIDYKLVIKLVDEKGNAYLDDQDPFAKVFHDKAVYRDNKASLVTRSNKQIPLNLSVSPLLDNQGELSGVVGVFRDVSQERAEEQRRAEFISTASHEMRTPVAAIEGYLALALNDRVSKIDTNARQYLEKAHSSTQHLGKLFQDLLTSAKAEDGRLVSHPNVVEMGEFLESLTDGLRFSAQKKGLLIDFVIGSSGSDATKSGDKVVRPLYYTHVDPERMREVITNLFDNAVKYTPSGKISVGLTGNNEVVQLYIRDTGAGIPPEDVPHLFQKFYRVDNSSTRTIGGTGLGLFICRKIVELYSGRIWVESELGKGSTFYINLPRLTSSKATELQKTEAAHQPSPLSSFTPV